MGEKPIRRNTFDLFCRNSQQDFWVSVNYDTYTLTHRISWVFPPSKKEGPESKVQSKQTPVHLSSRYTYFQWMFGGWGWRFGYPRNPGNQKRDYLGIRLTDIYGPPKPQIFRGRNICRPIRLGGIWKSIHARRWKKRWNGPSDLMKLGHRTRPTKNLDGHLIFFWV